MTFLIVNMTKSLNRFMEVFGLQQNQVKKESILKYFTSSIINITHLYYMMNLDQPNFNAENEIGLYIKTLNYDEGTMLLEKDYHNIPDGYLIIRLSSNVPDALIILIRKLLQAEEYYLTSSHFIEE